MARTTPQILVQLIGPGNAEPVRFDADVERRFLSLSYEDTEKGSDKCTLVLNNYDLRFPDDASFDRGNRLVVSWGYVGNMSPQRIVTITDWIPSAKEFKVEAKDDSAVMNKVTRDVIYRGVRRWSDVAKQIAERYGYGPDVQDIEESAVTADDIVQPNYTDGAMLQQMANRLGWVWFIDPSGFHFHPRRFGQQSRKTLRYFLPSSAGEESDMFDFPSFEKAPAAQPGKVTLQGVDPTTKEPFSVSADNASTVGRGGLADQLEVVDPRTLQTSLRERQGTEATAATSATSRDEAQREADQLYKNAQSNPVKGTVTVRGDPRTTAKSVVTFEGISQRLSGPYYLNSVTHQVKTGDYRMSLKFTRDGTSGAGTSAVAGPASAASVNDSKGPANNAASETLREVEVVDPRTLQTRTEFHP